MGHNTHDDGRLFGTDGRVIWVEPALELDWDAPAPADNVTVTKCRLCGETMPGPYRGHGTYFAPDDAYEHDAEPDR
jgi:hypothetical protein